jgi:hypothetical protein
MVANALTPFLADVPVARLGSRKGLVSTSRSRANSSITRIAPLFAG